MWQLIYLGEISVLRQMIYLGEISVLWQLIYLGEISILWPLINQPPDLQNSLWTTSLQYSIHVYKWIGTCVWEDLHLNHIAQICIGSSSVYLIWVHVQIYVYIQ